MKERLFTRDFALLILGQLISLFGNAILRLALSLYILEATGSAVVFGGLLSAAILPSVLLAPLGGVLADRGDRRCIMVALDALTGLSVLFTTVLLTPGRALGLIGALMILLAALGAFETPTVQACIPSLVTEQNLAKGNAAVHQTAFLASLAAPALGGILYGALGLIPVLWTSILCFFVTALFECLIRLPRRPRPAARERNPLAMACRDLSESVGFLFVQRRCLAGLLLLAALSGFFVVGAAVVGLPYLVRTVLGLEPQYFGWAESVLAAAAIAGGAAAGLWGAKIKASRLWIPLAASGALLVPAGMAFLLPLDTGERYLLLTASFAGLQGVVSFFSVLAVSLLQSQTPDHLLGKVMACTSALTLCAQPAGQLIYGFLFDRFREIPALVLLPTGILAGAVGLFSIGFFRRLEAEIWLCKTRL